MCGGDICSLTILKYLEDNTSADAATLLDECREQLARAMQCREDYLSSQDFNFADSIAYLGDEGFIELQEDKGREAILYLVNQMRAAQHGWRATENPFNAKIVLTKKFKLLQHHLGLCLAELHDNYIYGKYVPDSDKLKDWGI